MATEQQLIPDQAFEASGDLSSDQFHAVFIDGDGRITTVSSTTQHIDGILQDKPSAAGRAGAIRKIGKSKVMLGGTVNEGDTLAADTSGHAVAIDLAAITDRWLIGTSLTNGISGEIGTADLNIQYVGG